MNYLQIRALMANPEEMAIVYEKTKFLGLDNSTPLRQRMWHISNNITEIPLCQTCNLIPVKWTEKTSEYRRYCSSKCAHNSKEVKEKTEQTCLKKFGFKTNLQNEDNKEKQRKTCIKLYGVDNFSKSDQFLPKFTKTCMERYGVSNPIMLPEIQAKVDATNFSRYGKKRASQLHISDDVIEMKNDELLMRKWFYENKMSVLEIATMLNVNPAQLTTHFKNNLNIDISRHNVSSIEKQVAEFITSLGVDIECSNRQLIKPKELDIVSHVHRIAIELNGVAWHGERFGKDKNYHLNKKIKCNENGYRLVQILDTEWKNSQDIVKSRLCGFFGKNTRIWARKCVIKEIDTSTSKEFFEKCHIQGHGSQSIAFGLYFENELVAAMSFCKSRYNKKFQWELLRYANALFTNVIGGAGKLFSHFIKTISPISIISYCDLRWNTGNVYNQIGMVPMGSSKPNYMYSKSGKLYSRIKFQKHKLSNLLPNFDVNLSESANMKCNGYDKIWDCGNLIFVYTLKGD